MNLCEPEKKKKKKKHIAECTSVVILLKDF